MGAVIHCDFKSAPRRDPAERERVSALLRVAAGGLAAHVRGGDATSAVNPVRVSVDADQPAGDAVVEDVLGHRLAVSVGVYSTLRRMPPREDVREWIARREAAPRELGVDVVADVEWLSDHGLATRGHFGGERAEVEVADVAAALGWVRAHCLRAAVPRVSPEELAAWDERKVKVVDASDPAKERLVELTVSAAVKRFGPVYRGEISAAKLVEQHKLSRRDAELVARAVLKVLPRR